MKRLKNIVLLLAIVATGCKSGNSDTTASSNGESLKGNISISGAFALYPLAVKWAEEFQKLNPGVHIDVSGGGAGKGMTDALSKNVNLGMVSRAITDDEVKKGAWSVAVTKDAVLPTISDHNPVLQDILKKGIKKEVFQDIFINEKIKTWGEITGTGSKDKLTAYTRSDAAGAAESWAKYLGKKQEDLKGIGVNGDPGVAEAVKKDIGGIGYNNISFVYDIQTKKPYPGIVVVPIDINGNGIIDSDENFYDNSDNVLKAIASGKYPSPPARDLYFVSNGKPTDKITAAFLKWVLTDGQKYISESGFIVLPAEKVKAGLDKLNAN